jgi:RpiR family carbohydrate utilization transcriptional regulator
MADQEVLLLTIRGLMPSLNPALKKIGQYILDDPGRIKLLRIKDLAAECGVAEATVTRFVKTIGLSNFQELKIRIAEITTDRGRSEELVYDDVTNKDSLQSIVDKIVFTNIEAMKNTKRIIDADAMQRAIDALDRSDKIDIYGAGGSFITAMNAAMRFYRIGKRCGIYNDPNQQAVSASLLTPKDVAIGICNSGRTASTVTALKKAKESGARTICITNFSRTPITEQAEIVLYTSTQDSAFFQESMVSRVAQIIIIDILYAGLAVKNFSSAVKMIEKSAESLKSAFL